MATYFIPNSRDKKLLETQVPKKFFKSYVKNSANLKKAQKAYESLEKEYRTTLKYDSNPASLGIKRLKSKLIKASLKKDELQANFKSLDKQLYRYEKSQKERPVRHKAEMTYGEIKNGRIKETPGNRALNTGAALVIGAGVAAAITGIVFTGGAALVPIVLLGITLPQIGTLASSILDDRQERKDLAKEIQNEDKKVASKKAKKQQQRNANNLADTNSMTPVIGANTRVRKPQKELQNQIRTLEAQINSLKEQLQKVQTLQKASLAGLTVVQNKSKKTSKTTERAKIKTTKPNRSMSI